MNLTIFSEAYCFLYRIVINRNALFLKSITSLDLNKRVCFTDEGEIHKVYGKK